MATETNKKSKKELSTDKKTNKIELSEIEQKALDKWRKKNKERIDPPKFKEIEDNTMVNKEEDPDKCYLQMLATTGSTDRDFSKIILSQAVSTLRTAENNEEKVTFIAAFMHGLKPMDEMEGVIISQMVGTHNLIMEYMRRAILPGQYLEAGNDYSNRAYRLMNIFLKQMEALEKYRGKTIQQKMTVEHVHIHEGGQAVVGQIENRSKGEGDERKK